MANFGRTTMRWLILALAAVWIYIQHQIRLSHLSITRLNQTLKFWAYGLTSSSSAFSPKFLPNLEKINIFKSKLQTIQQSDLKPFPNLTELSLRYNDIEVIPDDLFAHNPSLKIVEFTGNSKLRAVGLNVIPNGVEEADFTGAGCIDSNASNEEELPALKAKIEKNCLKP